MASGSGRVPSLVIPCWTRGDFCNAFGAECAHLAIAGAGPPPSVRGTFRFRAQHPTSAKRHFAVTACLAWLLRRRSKRETPSESVERSGESVVLHERDLGDTGESRPYPGEIERLIANELEAEILRRTGLRRDDNA
jgi:hypothetical protein